MNDKWGNGVGLSKALPDVELADTAIPDSYVWPKNLAPTVAHDEFGKDEVPVIDLNGLELLDGSQYREIAAQLGQACASWGFFQVVNHGVSDGLLDRIQTVSKMFFELPLETKEKLEVRLAGDRMLGYGFYEPNRSRISMRYWSEGLFMDTTHLAEFSSIVWPEDSSSRLEFCRTVEAYVAQLNELGLKVVRLLLNSLGIYSDNYDKYAPKNPALLRLNHYPPCPNPMQAMGLLAHYDGNLFTILHQGNVAGLQVLKDDHWIAVRPHPQAFAINVGDMLQAISNGRYKSARHKAVVNNTQDRYSVAYFVQSPDWDQITPLPELVDECHPMQYRPFTWPEFLKIHAQHPLSALEQFFLSPPNHVQ